MAITQKEVGDALKVRGWLLCLALKKKIGKNFSEWVSRDTGPVPIIPDLGFIG